MSFFSSFASLCSTNSAHLILSPCWISSFHFLLGISARNQETVFPIGFSRTSIWIGAHYAVHLNLAGFFLFCLSLRAIETCVAQTLHNTLNAGVIFATGLGLLGSSYIGSDSSEEEKAVVKGTGSIFYIISV